MVIKTRISLFTTHNIEIKNITRHSPVGKCTVKNNAKNSNQIRASLSKKLNLKPSLIKNNRTHSKRRVAKPVKKTVYAQTIDQIVWCKQIQCCEKFINNVDRHTIERIISLCVFALLYSLSRISATLSALLTGTPLFIGFNRLVKRYCRKLRWIK